MSRYWNFVEYPCDMPKAEGWYYVIDRQGMEYKDWFYAEQKKFSINNDIKAWARAEQDGIIER